MKVTDIMTHPVITASEDATLEEIAQLMLDKHIGGAPIVDGEGKLTGLITESDFAAKEEGFPFSTFRWPQVLGQWLPKEGIEQVYKKSRTMTARNIMTPDVITANEDDTLEDVLRLMMENDVHRIPIVRDGKPVGMITRRDLLHLVLKGKLRESPE